MNVTEATGLQSKQIDALKGVLILLIVVGHNPLITGAFLGSFEALYSFHVLGFLLLPFWFPVAPLSGRLVKDRLVRYMVPHYVFYGIGCVLFALVFVRNEWGRQLTAVIVGALIGSADTVKAGSGLSLFWFLPALLSLTLLRSAAASGFGALVLVLGIAGHLFVGALPEAVRVWTPFGLLIALFTYPLGALLAWAWPRYMAARLRTWGLAAALVWGGTLAYIYLTRSVFNIGELAMASVLRPQRLLLHDVSALAGFVTLAAMCGTWLGKIDLLASLGRASLLIFLVHSFVFQGLMYAARALGVVSMSFAAGWVFFVLTVAISHGLALLFTKSEALRRWITPRAAADWPPTARPAQPLPAR